MDTLTPALRCFERFFILLAHIFHFSGMFALEFPLFLAQYSCLVDLIISVWLNRCNCGCYCHSIGKIIGTGWLEWGNRTVTMIAICSWSRTSSTTNTICVVGSTVINNIGAITTTTTTYSTNEQ